MQISITPELESNVKAKVDSGLYSNESEYIQEALKFFATHEAWMDELKSNLIRMKLKSGLKQLHKEDAPQNTSPEALESFFDNVLESRTG